MNKEFSELHVVLQRIAQAITEEKDVSHQSFFWLIPLTGLTKEELKSLEWANVNFKKGVIRTKTALIRITDEIRTELQRIPVGRTTLGNWPTYEYIFNWGFGVTTKSIEKAEQRIGKKAGLKDFKIDDLRKLIASDLVLSTAHERKQKRAVRVHH